MKTTRFVLKIIGASLLVLSAACFLVGYWSKIIGDLRRINAKMTGIPIIPTEYDDFDASAQA